MEPLTRELLYDQVWAEPMAKLAPRYGLSDRGLAKICAAYEIPVPHRGYWAKLAHGHKVTKAPLPSWNKGEAPRIYIREREVPLAKPDSPTLAPEIAFEQLPENRIVVPARLGKIHPLVERTRALLKASRPANWTRGLVWANDSLDVKVAPASISRSIRIMQALLEALERRGHKVSLSTSQRTGIVVSMLGEEVVVHLIERTRQVQTGKDYPRVELVPTGVLSLEIGDWYTRAVISDGAKKKLEQRLNDFVVKMIEDALESRQQREERQRQEAERQEQERLRALEEKRRQEEEKKIAQWDQWMQGWRRARETRAFVRAIRKRLGPLEDGSETLQWVTWAEQYAARIDPFGTP